MCSTATVEYGLDDYAHYAYSLHSWWFSFFLLKATIMKNQSHYGR